MNMAQAKRVLETALLTAGQPLSLRDMRVLFDDEIGADTLRQLLQDLQFDWTHKGLELTLVASGWRFQSRPELRHHLDRLHPEKPPKYTRAVLETLLGFKRAGCSGVLTYYAPLAARLLG